jgi:hypothetical protein
LYHRVRIERRGSLKKPQDVKTWRCGKPHIVLHHDHHFHRFIIHISILRGDLDSAQYIIIIGDKRHGFYRDQYIHYHHLTFHYRMRYDPFISIDLYICLFHSLYINPVVYEER